MDDSLLTAKATNLLDLIGPTTKLRKVAAREYAGSCPICGGDDRFRVNLDKGWFCRHCQGEPGSGGHWGDAVDFVMWHDRVDFKAALYKLTGINRLDPVLIEQRKTERQAADQARQETEQAEQTRARDDLNESGIWREYHDNLDKYNARPLWRNRGLSDWWQDYYQLGFCPERIYDNTSYQTITIPYFKPRAYQHPDGGQVLECDCIGLKHRLLGTDAPGGKYRSHAAGYGQALYRADLVMTDLWDNVLICEGEIKSMVVYSSLWSGDDTPENCAAPFLSVIGTAGRAMKPCLHDEIKDAERIWICLDPDAINDAYHLADTLGRERCQILDLPAKIDDLILAGALDAQTLLERMAY
jgi:hypothetical protein